MEILNWAAVHYVLAVIFALIAADLAVCVLKAGLIAIGRAVK